LNSDGSFSYTPAANFNGSDSFTYRASDGTLTSQPATVTLTINAVNDPPSFSLATSNVSVNAADGAQTLNDFATGISAGPTAESGQTVSFQVSNDNPSAFTVQPEISETGVLSFTPDSSSAGMAANVTVVAKDNGGGGSDTSAPQTFTIMIN